MGDLKVAETFQDAVYITVTATGAAAVGLAPTCTFVKISNNTRTAGTVQEVGSGWYRVTDFTNDAAGTWATEWAVAGAYTIWYPRKIFKAGGGDIADVKLAVAAVAGVVDNIHDTDLPDVHTDVGTAITNIGTVDALHDVPAQNAVANANVRDVVGNKTDDPTWFTDDVSSLMKFAKAGVSTGGGLTYSGKCDAGMAASTTIIVCDDLKGFGDDFFNTDWVMIVNLNDNNHGVTPEGDAPRDITDYTSLTGTFTVTAFGANVEASDKIVVARRGLYTTDAIGLKTTPATNSLAYRTAQFIAGGEGDFAGSTALPNNISLYDILGGANGHPAFPAAAAPANGVNLMAVAHLIADRTEHHLITETFFSPSQEAVIVTDAAPDLALPSVTLPNITGTIVRVKAGFKFRMVENTNAGANSIDTAQYIQVRVDTPGAWANAIAFVDTQFSIAASTREGGDCIVGTYDLVGTVTAFNDIYEFQWENADAHLPNLEFNDVQTFLIVSYY